MSLKQSITEIKEPFKETKTINLVVDDILKQKLNNIQTRLTLMVSSFDKFALHGEMDRYIRTKFYAINHMLNNTNLNEQRIHCIEMNVLELELILGL